MSGASASGRAPVQAATLRRWAAAELAEHTERTTARLAKVDLVAHPLMPELSARMSYRVALREGWVPWWRDGSTVVVATTGGPSADVERVVQELYGSGDNPVNDVVFVATTPPDLWQALASVHEDLMLFEAQDRLAELIPEASARAGLTTWQRLLPIPVVVGLVVALVERPTTTIIALMAVSNLVFAASMLFKAAASLLAPLRSFHDTGVHLAEMRARRAQGLPPLWRERIPDADLPPYTVLVPVFREANIVGKVMTSIGALDYPVDKLDVMILLEADDTETIAAARAMDPPPHIRLVVVPPGHPQTKPRACNYGLLLARGRYVVIYDAEDRPERGQLRAAVGAFERDRFEQRHGLTRRPPLAVAQAALHYFNADYNILTRMFAVEYAHWFEAMLPGMELARMPIPLGGTSNHFDAEILRGLGAWDPYNVTEDADAGLRVSVTGYRVGVIPSTTGEEACAEVPAWIRQRTRWIKGYMITAAVNMRHPIRFARRVGPRGVIGFVGLIASTPLAFLVYPLTLAFTALTYIGVQMGGLELPLWAVRGSELTFGVGITAMILTALAAARRRYNWRVAGFALFLPVYWGLHSIAAWRAFYQVLFDPHRWEKTPHGLTEEYESDAHHGVG